MPPRPPRPGILFPLNDMMGIAPSLPIIVIAMFGVPMELVRANLPA